MPITRRSLALAAGAILAVGAGTLSGARAAAQGVVEVWKSTECACCDKWTDHLRAAGFEVTMHHAADMQAVRAAHGVPETLASCHTATVGGYAIEGLVPASDIQRVLAKRPGIKGLAAPGMPQRAPGMDIPGHPYEVISFGGPGGETLFARY
ncbi:MAG TPA: DUF411 domain-containing protein [Acetobacteraceae bacterium]|nr:DUF411 domain-containing protein [Acetobacteraceae bacterium]